MDGLVFVAVLGAAILHATWNAIIKAVPDQRVAAGLLSVAEVVLGAVGAAVLPAPDPAAWPFIAVSSVLQSGYLLLLVHAYRYGRFGQVYPLARGLPPLLVTVFSLAVLGERLTAGQLAGVVLVSLALVILVFPTAGGGLWLAAGAGVLIASYTIVDGVGVRESGQLLSYAAWLFLVQGLLVLGTSWAMYGSGYPRAAARSAPLGLLGGALASIAYGTVLWAQTQAPLALVSAVRETSLLFAGAIGTLVFGERFSRIRLVATIAAVTGLVLLRAA